MQRQSELQFRAVETYRKVTGYNTPPDANDHALSFVWLSPIITIAENQNFQVVVLAFSFCPLGTSLLEEM